MVAAAADYFFDTHWKATLSALALNAIPIDREVTGRKSSDMFRDLLADGHSLLIYPEGGRSPDGWGQEFKGGAAYLSSRSGAPVVPVFIDGTGPIFGKGMKRPKPGRTKVVFGAPLRPLDDENTRRYNARIEAAVTRLGDEALTDYWTATKRAAQGHQPVADRSRVQRLASAVGARRAPQARRRRPPPPSEAPLARPRLAPTTSVALDSGRVEAACCDRGPFVLAGAVGGDVDQVADQEARVGGVVGVDGGELVERHVVLLASRDGLSPATTVCWQPTPAAAGGVVCVGLGVGGAGVGTVARCRCRRCRPPVSRAGS